MKKYSYIVAVACIMVGALGLTGMYVTERSQQKQEKLAKEKQDSVIEFHETQIPQVNLDELASNTENTQQEVEKENSTQKTVTQKENTVAKSESKTSESTKTQQTEEVTQVETVQKETLHFNAKNGIVWPIEGTVLLDYSKDATIYFPTLQQYQYNPAMVIQGEVNSKVYFAAKGKITNIETNEVTGCTVTQDIGDGYIIKYGQLKELNFKVGDMVESGQVVGYVSEPTKYYSMEGPNVYFQVLKDNEPIDPQELLDN